VFVVVLLVVLLLLALVVEELAEARRTPSEARSGVLVLVPVLISLLALRCPVILRTAAQHLRLTLRMFEIPPPPLLSVHLVPLQLMPIPPLMMVMLL
jgi:hypothetical protein